MNFNYRVTARRVILAAGPGEIRAAPDTGMILKLIESSFELLRHRVRKVAQQPVMRQGPRQI